MRYKHTDGMLHIFLGIGININSDKEDLKNIDVPATSLQIETNKTYNIEKIVTKLEEEFSKNLSIFKKQGFEPFHAEFEKLTGYEGKKRLPARKTGKKSKE